MVSATATAHDEQPPAAVGNAATDDVAAAAATATDIAGIAAALQQLEDQQQQQQQLEQPSTVPPVDGPPPPLPPGWVLTESRSQPGCHYYYNMDTGVSTWASPQLEAAYYVAEAISGSSRSNPSVEQQQQDDRVGAAVSEEQQQQQPPPFVTAPEKSNTKKRTREEEQQQQQATNAAIALADALNSTNPDTATTNPPKKKQQTGTDDSSTTNKSSSSRPKQVRVLHILRKHKDARRPSSWRQSVITIPREQAAEELRGLQELLREVEGDPAELRATMEELARTESDCSSAKRGGDLGFFGPKKMQPSFEEAAFKLNVGQLSDIVESASGMHLILRIG